LFQPRARDVSGNQFFGGRQKGKMVSLTADLPPLLRAAILPPDGSIAGGGDGSSWPRSAGSIGAPGGLGGDGRAGSAPEPRVKPREMAKCRGLSNVANVVRRTLYPSNWAGRRSQTRPRSRPADRAGSSPGKFKLAVACPKHLIARLCLALSSAHSSGPVFGFTSVARVGDNIARAWFCSD
jgi:hypothetical protein